MKVSAAMSLLCAVLALASCGEDSASTDSQRTSSAAKPDSTEATGPIEPVGRPQGAEPRVKQPSKPYPKKLVVRDIEVGDGAEALNGHKVTIQFNSIDFEGKPFESTWGEFGHPFRFELGGGEVSPGWEKGILGMKVGGRRELLIPASIIAQSGISVDGGIVYVVDLLDVG